MTRTDDPTTPPEPRRENVREYRKTATVMAGQAPTGGIIPTIEGDHTYEAGDYIAGPGQAGEYWPVKRSIFEATYATVTPPEPVEARYRPAIECECVPGHRCDCEDLRSLLRRILTSAEYPKMEAEGLAATALGLTWNESRDRYE